MVTPAEEIADKDRQLRAVTSAAFRAMFRDATPAEIRAALEAGITEAQASPGYAAQRERLAAARDE
jgi:hypothetical protein